MQMAKSLREVKSFIIKVLSLSDRKYRIVTLFLILFMLFFIPVSFFEKLPNLSICSGILGEYCFSVGITRGVSSLLKGDFVNAIDYNIFSVLVVVMIIAIIVLDLVKLKIKKNEPARI